MTMTFAFMDAGQGDATLVVYPDGSLMLVDCGAIKNKKEVLPAIKQVLDRFVPADKTIDHLVLTHPDQDHYNLVKDLFISGPYKVRDVWYGGDLCLYKNGNESNATYDWVQEQNHHHHAFKAGYFGVKEAYGALSRLDLGVEVYVLAANASGWPENQNDSNANSIVLLFRYMDHNVFLMGDATRETEQKIVKLTNQENPYLFSSSRDSVLKLGHHGSNTASSQEWIEAITPIMIFVSSDTRKFGSGGGMPTQSHLEDIKNWSGKVMTLSSELCHPVVVYWDQPTTRARTEGTFAALDPTCKAVCTTLYRVEYYADDCDPAAEGGTWYYDIQGDGSTLPGWTGPRTTCKGKGR